MNKIQTAAAKGGFKKGVWRWKVKTLTDPDAKKVDFHKHYAMTQAQIAALKSPGLTMKYKNKPRIEPYEFRVIEIKGIVEKLKLEVDGDYHMVVESAAGRNDGLNCELPKPEFALGSVGLPEIKAMRKLVESRIGKGDKPGTIIKLPTPLPAITVRGVGFWDMQGHGGADLKSGFELHPVLVVEIR